MKKRAFFDQERPSTPGRSGGHGLQTAAAGVGLDVPARSDVSRDEPRRHAPKHGHAARLSAGGVQSPSPGIVGHGPASETPGLYFVSWRLRPSALSPATKSGRRKDVDLKKDADPFHDSEIDIFDLYNACNGVEHDGILDVNQLDEYTPAEAEELNVPRLREIWDHSASGCLKCKSIVSTLNSIRGTLSEYEEEPFDGQTEAFDIDAIDSI